MKIKLKDYERIYKTINTIIVNEDGDPSVACTFFAFYGVRILREHYKIDARPAAGLCMYHLGGNNNVLSFAAQENNIFISNTDAFHCWVIADDWLIDFMAPAFGDADVCKSFNVTPKMVQKPLSSMSNSPFSLTLEGEFYFEENTEVLENRKNYLSSSLAYADLADICSKWYKKPPKKMLPSIQIGDAKGNINSVSLVGNTVVGAW